MAAAPRRAVESGDLAANGDGSGRPEIDWEAVERSPEFRELIAKKKAFVVPATVFFLAWYFGFIVLAGYAPDFMGSEFIADGLTVGLRARAQPVRHDVGARLDVHAPRRPGVRPARRARRRSGHSRAASAPARRRRRSPRRAPHAPTGEVAPQ